MTGHAPTRTVDPTGQRQKQVSRPDIPFGNVDMDGFAPMLESGPRGRDEAVILNAIVGRSSTSFEAWGAGTFYEMETFRKDVREAEKGGGIVVRKDIDQDVERQGRVTWPEDVAVGNVSDSHSLQRPSATYLAFLRETPRLLD